MENEKLDNQSKNNYLPYNGEPLQENEILVPQFITREYAELIDAMGVRTWYKSGIPYMVMFVPVPKDQAHIALQAFNADVNDYLDEKLGPNRYSRCLIPQSDGSYRPCPKESNGKRNTCRECPLRGKLEKEDRNPISLESLEEENFHPMANESSAESCAMFGFLLQDLLDDFTVKCPRYADIIQLGLSGMDKKAILQQLPMKKTQAHQTYNDCEIATKNFLKS